MQQNIIQGINKLPLILNESGSKKLFIVTGSHSYQSLNFKDMIKSLDIERIYFTEFTPNPLYEQISKGIELFKSEACDGILAIGGGSPIDVAKCIKLAVLAKEGNDAIIPPLVNIRVEIDGAKIPFIAIPTTAGTGSESTHNAVMYYEGAKQTVTNDGILPNYAFLEPSVLKSLPQYQKKCTMMDALCQGIESWWSVNSTEESYEYSRKTIELIIQNWEKYIFENDDQAAANIMLGANYSGRAINITQTTAAHAMSYKITSLYGFPHGHAVAVCLPVIWKYMLDNLYHKNYCVDTRGTEHLICIFNDIAKAMNCDTTQEAISKFKDMLSKLVLVNPVDNERNASIQILTNSINTTRLKNNPIVLDKNSVRLLYNIIVK
nr:phosphonoacetaldehyde reductase [uncultured Bacteroides sp.]